MNKFMILFLLIFFSCSFDGGKVKDTREFLKEKKEIINLKLIQCGISGIDTRNNFDSSLTVLLLMPESSFYNLGFLKTHVTNKDAQFCFDSLYSVPCGLNIGETARSILVTDLLYCNPKHACLGDKQNIGQGEFCISGE